MVTRIELRNCADDKLSIEYVHDMLLITAYECSTNNRAIFVCDDAKDIDAIKKLLGV